MHVVWVISQNMTVELQTALHEIVVIIHASKEEGNGRVVWM